MPLSHISYRKATKLCILILYSNCFKSPCIMSEPFKTKGNSIVRCSFVLMAYIIGPFLDISFLSNVISMFFPRSVFDAVASILPWNLQVIVCLGSSVIGKISLNIYFSHQLLNQKFSTGF